MKPVVKKEEDPWYNFFVEWEWSGKQVIFVVVAGSLVFLLILCCIISCCCKGMQTEVDESEESKRLNNTPKRGGTEEPLT